MFRTTLTATSEIDLIDFPSFPNVFIVSTTTYGDAQGTRCVEDSGECMHTGTDFAVCHCLDSGGLIEMVLLRKFYIWSGLASVSITVFRTMVRAIRSEPFRSLHHFCA